MQTLLAASVFLSAALLFLVQPMIARMLLPMFGGGPAVWTTCVAVFQATLLGGYLYAHLAATRLSVRWQVVVHLGLLVAAAVSLPVIVPADRAPPGGADPAPWLIAGVATAVGLPFFVLSASAPLLQRWFVVLFRSDPYRLYAASNAGSLLGLLAYPLLAEPFLGLRDQGVAWSVGYGALAVLVAVCGWRTWRAGTAEPSAAPDDPPTGDWGRRFGWIALAFVPSSLMLGTTAALTADVPPLPMLWAGPLAAYLLTFVIAFGRPAGRLAWTVWAVPAGVAVAALGIAERGAFPLPGLIALHLAAFTAVALGCHAELSASRPRPARMTEFYLFVSLGGVLGGLANAAAPAMFNSVAEFPLALAAAAVVIPAARAAAKERPGKWLLPVGGVAVAAVLYVGFAPADSKVIYQVRSFFGVSRVVQGRNENTHQLVHGSIEHGGQVLGTDEAGRRIAPFLYYHPDGPIGQVFQARMKAGIDAPVGVVGLGCGALAYYWVRDQPFVFFEIDPAVIRIAKNSSLFTFLRDSKAKCEVVPGDARLSLERQPDNHFGLLVIDAFSGDAIPVHLLTAEALDLYRRKLAPGGVIAFHISNNYFELEPPLAALAARDGMAGLSRRDEASHLTEADIRRGRLPCHWLLLAPSPEGLRWVEGDARWKPLTARPGQRVWTDDYANVLGALRMLDRSRPAAGGTP